MLAFWGAPPLLCKGGSAGDHRSGNNQVRSEIVLMMQYLSSQRLLPWQPCASVTLYVWGYILNYLSIADETRVHDNMHMSHSSRRFLIRPFPWLPSHFSFAHCYFCCVAYPCTS